MKLKTLGKFFTTALLVASAFAILGCDDITAPEPKQSTTQSNTVNLTGHVSLDNVKAHNVTVEAAGISVHPDVNGDYTIAGTRKFAGRSLADSTAAVVHIIVNDTDTLRSIPVTSWSGILPTNYVVQRNVSVTLPVKYAGMDVVVGYFNTTLHPGTYSSVTLGRYSWVNNSGFIYSAYDSAAYANASYLYSAVAIVKSRDSVVAFSKTIDTVTAKVGNIGFDSGVFVSTMRTDSAFTRPWWTVEIPNGTNLALVKGKDVVVSRDSTMHFDTVIHVSGTLYLDSIPASDVTISIGSLVTHPDMYGKFFISDTCTVTGNITPSVVGRVIVSVGHDTLRVMEIPAWTYAVPSMFVVRRSSFVSVPARYSKDSTYLVRHSPSGAAPAITHANKNGFVYTSYDSLEYGKLPYLYIASAKLLTSDGSLVAYTDHVDTVKLHSGNISFDSTSFVTELRTDSTIIKRPWWTSEQASATLSKTTVTIVDTVTLDSSWSLEYNVGVGNAMLDSDLDVNGNYAPYAANVSDSALSKAVVSGFALRQFTNSDTVSKISEVLTVIIQVNAASDSIKPEIGVLGRSFVMDSIPVGKFRCLIPFSKFSETPAVAKQAASKFETYFPVQVLQLVVQLIRKTTVVVYR